MNDLLDLLNDDVPPMGNMGMSQPATPSTNNVQNDLMSILGSGNNAMGSSGLMSPNSGLMSPSNSGLSGLGGLNMMSTPQSQPQPQKTVMLPANEGKGMEISAVFVKRQNKFFMELTFSNKTAQPLSEIAIQFNKNT